MGIVWELDTYTDRDLWFENQMKLVTTTVLSHVKIFAIQYCICDLGIE